MSGTFEGTTTLFGATDITLTTTGQGGFLARFDATGAVVWAYAVPAGQLAVSTVVTVAGGSTIARYGSDGATTWAKTIVASNYAAINGVAMLANGAALVTGELVGSTVFGMGEANETTLTTTGTFAYQADAFIAKYNADGSLAWARTAATLGVAPQAIAALADGSFVITGYFGEHAESSTPNGMTTFGPGTPNQVLLPHQALDMFVARFAADGTLQWARHGASAGHEFGQAIAAKPDGSSIVVAGWFGIYNGLTMTLGQVPSQLQLTAAGTADSFIASYTGSGDLRWAKRAGLTGRTVAGRIEMFDDGSTVVAGGFEGDATFGPGESGARTLTAVGNADPFVAKLSP